MKQTGFRFELRLVATDPVATLRGLEAKLQTLSGMNSVTTKESDQSADVVTLQCYVSFAGGDQAKKLHRQVSKIILAYQGISIPQISTTLSDIF